MPPTLNTDHPATYGVAITELKDEGKYPKDLVDRQVKYLNNPLESDHGMLKRLLNPLVGFKSMNPRFRLNDCFEMVGRISC